MYPPYLSSDAETQGPKQQPSTLFTSSASATSMPGFSDLRLPPFHRPLSHDNFHTISSSGGAFATSSESAPNRRASPNFHSYREQRQFPSPYEHLSLSVPSVPDRLPTRNFHGSQTDYPAPLVTHPGVIPGTLSVSFSIA